LTEHGKKATALERPKLTLGKKNGGAIRLGPAAERLGICEGLETGLSAAQLYGGSIWVGCGSDYSNIILPDITQHVTIYSDNGAPGQKAADRAAEAFHARGKRVTMARPFDGFDDFNTYLQAQAGSEAA